MRNLSVPYKSQWDSDANGTNNDCGPASIAMILNYYGEKVSTDQVFNKTGAGQGLIDIQQMLNAVSAYGYKAERKLAQTAGDIRDYIDKDTPVIALVHYGSLKSTQDKRFKGGHFLVVVGYRDDGYFVNDPNFKDSLRGHGDHHFYTKQEFEQAWQDCSLDDNRPNSLIVIKRKASPSNETKEQPKDNMQISELLKKYNLKSINELDQKLIEHVGVSWGSEKESADPQYKGGFLGDARRKQKLSKENEKKTIEGHSKEIEELKRAHAEELKEVREQTNTQSTQVPKQSQESMTDVVNVDNKKPWYQSRTIFLNGVVLLLTGLVASIELALDSRLFPNYVVELGFILSLVNIWLRLVTNKGIKK